MPPALASAVTVPPEMVTAPLTWRAEEAALLSLYCSPCVVLLLVMVTVLPVKEALPPTWTVGTLLEALVAVREPFVTVRSPSISMALVVSSAVPTVTVAPLMVRLGLSSEEAFWLCTLMEPTVREPEPEMVRF